jgi:hypothetical protein
MILSTLRHGNSQVALSILPQFFSGALGIQILSATFTTFFSDE